MEDPSYNQTLTSHSMEITSRIVWVSEPTSRGTYGILSMCLSTMFICVWNTLHMDVPTKRLSFFQSVIQGAYWIVVASLCPEVLLYNAFCQFARARYLQKLMSSNATNTSLTLRQRTANGSAREAQPMNVEVGPVKYDVPLFTYLTHYNCVGIGGFQLY